MKIAILSDIHDNLVALKAALSRVSACDVLLFCGDLCSPFVVKALGEGFPGPIHIVFGNNDGDLFRITQRSLEHAQIQLHGESATLTLDGRRMLLHHFDALARPLAASGHFDVVCFGHNHQFEISEEGGCLLINPGEVFGGLTGQSTCVIYDTQTGQAERVDISKGDGPST